VGVVDRRAPLPPREAGDARRTLGDVAAAIGGGCEPPAGTRRPADIFVSTLMGMEALNRLNRLQQKAYWRAQKKRYPRSLRRP
jgi:hypothetical protein